jgi:CcmD family protein
MAGQSPIVAAVSLHDDYVAAAYLVLFALVLIYVAIMATKLGRLERELAELNELADQPPADSAVAGGVAPNPEGRQESEPVGAGGAAS